MQMILSIAVVVQIISAVAVIVLVLLQHGKGADLGAAFGSGAYQKSVRQNASGVLGTMTMEQTTGTDSTTDNNLQSNQVPR